jgi:methyl-accepting chemotaxis protein
MNASTKNRGLRPTLGRALEASLLRATTIRLRLILAFSVLLLLLLGVAGLAAWRLIDLNRVAATHLQTDQTVGAWVGEIRASTIALQALAHSDSAALTQVMLPRLQLTDDRFEQWRRQGGKSAPAAAELISLRDAYAETAAAILAGRQAGHAADAVALMDSQLVARGERYAAAVRGLAPLNGSVPPRSESPQASADSGLQLLALACLAGGIFQFILCWLITRSIVRPIRVASKIASKVAAGDLTVAVHAEGQDESTQLFGSLRDMIDNLRLLVTEAAGDVHTVSATSTHIAHVHQDLSQRTDDQTQTLGHTALSLEQLTTTVGRNAENARLAVHLAIGASEVARRGGEAIGDVVSTMAGLSEASRRINEITGVIDAIAFQTNILALNAAVEAARAGDQGRGFAVVAGEVRVLAQRSAAAAREIKVLVGDSVGRVDAGTQLVDGAGRTMEEIVEAVEKVTDLIGEIAAGSQDQSSDLRQVNAAMTQMGQAVQHNATLVEDATAATDAMTRQAQSLLQMLARFKLDQPGTLPPVVDSVAVDAARTPAAIRTLMTPIRTRAAAARPSRDAAAAALASLGPNYMKEI